ncbi:hypothetical protein ES703_57119 [subsurface metagenome]
MPALYYQNGGVETNSFGKTNAEGLFVVGEGSGDVYGKNRAPILLPDYRGRAVHARMIDILK